MMEPHDAGTTVRYLIRDRDAKFPALFDEVLADAGIAAMLTGIRMPRMNAVMERWMRTCRSELLDRTLIWNQAHLLHAPRVRDPLQRAPDTPDTAPDRAAASRARTDHRAGPNHPPRYPKTRPPRRDPARVRTHRLTSTDE